MLRDTGKFDLLRDDELLEILKNDMGIDQFDQNEHINSVQQTMLKKLISLQRDEDESDDIQIEIQNAIK